MDHVIIRLIEKVCRELGYEASEFNDFLQGTQGSGHRLRPLRLELSQSERERVVLWLNDKIQEALVSGDYNKRAAALEIKRSLDFSAKNREARREAEPDFRPVYCLFTILPVEIRAVWEEFRKPEQEMRFLKRNKLTYIEVASDPGKCSDSIIVHSEEAQVSASSRAERVLNAFPSLECVINVGVCGGFPDYQTASSHVRPGDICVANERGILEFDRVHRSDIKNPAISVSSHFREIFKNILTRDPELVLFANDAEKDEFERLRSESDPLFSYPDGASAVQVDHPTDSNNRGVQFFSGLVGSSNGLLTDITERERLRSKGVFCADMESAAVARVCADHKKDFFTVRASVDYCCPQKNKSWHSFSSKLAARFTKLLIKEHQGSS